MNNKQYLLDTPENIERAVLFTTQLLETINEGGKWVVPRSNAIYTIYNDRKIAVRIKSDDAVDRILLIMGWDLREEI